MIDIHSHVLFNVDDGCFHINTSIEAIKEEVKGGVTDIFCTPHIDTPDVDFKKLKEHFDILKEKIKEENINVSIHTGAEIGPNFNPSSLINKGINITLAGNSKYALIGPFFTEEFYKNSFQAIIYDLQMLKVIPIIAHPERMSYFQKDPELLINFMNQGCLLQINAPSLLGMYNETCKFYAERMLQLNWVTFIASDKHRKYNLSLLEETYKYLKENYNEDLANKILCENPKKILDNIPMVNYDYKPWSETTKEKKSIWDFFKKKT